MKKIMKGKQQKLQEWAKRIASQGGMEMSWMQVVFSNRRTNMSEATVSVLWGIFQSDRSWDSGEQRTAVQGLWEIHKTDK